jgi:regulator of protease activity HflC (stomatin/prohibitin superfamily)
MEDLFEENKKEIPKWKKYLRKKMPQLIIIGLILSFLIVFFWPRIFVTIGSGHAGVMFRRFAGGTVVDKIYSEGFYFVPPWDKLTVYNVRVQTVPKKLIALTKNGLRIIIYYAVRFHPEYNTLGLLHKIVGPDYAEKVVFPEAEATIRDIVGRFSSEDIYTLRHSIVQPIVNETIERVVQRYVLIDNIMITKIELPPDIASAIEQKVTYQIQVKAYDFLISKEKKEATRKKIEAGGIKNYNEIVNSSLSDKILTWQGVKATMELSKSNNAKIIIIGGGKKGLPVILNTDGTK